jgi:hypothetical protein
MGVQQAAACGRWGCRELRRRPLAAALAIHTNNCSNPISMRVCGLLRAAVYSSETQEPVASKPRPGTVSDPATSVAWCVT